MDTEKVSEKIRKLLALSGSSNEHEASLALEKANELLRKYNLDMIEVMNSDPDKGRAAYSVADESWSEISGEWRKDLLSGVSRFNFCKVLYTNGKNPHVIGESQNVRSVEIMFEWIEQQIETQAIIAALVDKRQGESTVSFKNSFRIGAVTRLRERMNEVMKESQEATTAITICHEAPIRDFINERYGRTFAVSRKVSNGSSAAGYRAGFAAGNAIHFQKQVK